MARVRLVKQPKEPPDQPPKKQRPRQHTSEPKAAPEGSTAAVRRGLSERQWVISLLVVSALLLLLTFRGCILPSGVGPKSKKVVQPSSTPAATTQPEAGANEYTVKPGDNLGKIAQGCGISLETLLQANKLNRSSILQVGQKLQIPGGCKPGAQPGQ